MSSLNLTPNPVIIAAQTAIFLLNAFVIKKLILQPYLEVLNKRRALTSGKTKKADELMAEVARGRKTIQDRLAEAGQKAFNLVQEAKAEAEAKRRQQFESAKAAADQHILAKKQEIKSELENELKRTKTASSEMIKNVFLAVTQ